MYVRLTADQLARVKDYAGEREDDELLAALDDTLPDEGETLVMTAGTVRSALDGYEEYEQALEWAEDEQIEALIGDEPLYERWHEMCKQIGDELLEEYEQQLPTAEDAEYERAQASDEWQQRHGGGL